MSQIVLFMDPVAENSFDVGFMDGLAARDTPLHRLDARAKLLTTSLFIVAVVSFDKYAVSALIPFFLYPVFLLSAGDLPVRYILKKALWVSPFAVFVGIFNPLLDRQVILHLGELGISGGWQSFASILLRFALTVSAALALVALTGINAICEALMKWGVPGPFVVQLLFLNRFLSVLAGEADRMSRARALRGFRKRKMDIGIFIQIAGHLLLRAVERAERVYRAMLCRGFDGHIRVVRFTSIGLREVAFVTVWGAVFALFRCVNLPVELGNLIIGMIK